MYKKAKRYEAMVKLVGKHRPDVLKETHQYLGQQLEMDGSLKEAEVHYAEAGEWLSAVNMCVHRSSSSRLGFVKSGDRMQKIQWNVRRKRVTVGYSVNPHSYLSGDSYSTD